MSIEEAFAAVVLAMTGGSGVVGLAMTYLRRYIDRKLEAGEEEAARRLEHRWGVAVGICTRSIRRKRYVTVLFDRK